MMESPRRVKVINSRVTVAVLRVIDRNRDRSISIEEQDERKNKISNIITKKCDFPVGIYLLKVNNRNARTRC